ncbi:L-2,4-diaminobutyric acid acetyltransferase [Burkholderiales bacterium]|nr:L-2,4-diaminobutyric acid acetyltransferase [Burkholderiales bacterium]
MTANDLDIDVRVLGPADAALLERVADGLIPDDVDSPLAAAFLADPRRVLAVALAGGRVVGIATGIRSSSAGTPAGLDVRDIAVAPALRRRGVGRRLLAALLEHGRALGCREARADAGRDDVAVRRLCASAGGREVPDPVVRVTFALSPLR